MEQSPSWEANRFAASQEISVILSNLKAHYRIHKCPPPISILSQLNSVHTLHPTSWRPILLSSHLRLGLPIGLLPSGFPTKVQYTPLPSPIRTTCPVQSHSSQFHHTHNNEWVQIIKLIIMKFSPLPCYLVPLRPKYSQHPIPKHPPPTFLPQC
jgi:hypothetical protein